MLQAGYHHANIVASQLRDGLPSRNDEVVAMLQQVVQSQVLPLDILEEEVGPFSHHANATTSESIQLEMLHILCQMQQDNYNNNNNNTNNTNNNNHNSHRFCKTPDDTNLSCHDKHDYCWTHSGCNNKSGECRVKAPGHKNNATLANHMGSSNVFCSTPTSEA